MLFYFGSYLAQKKLTFRNYPCAVSSFLSPTIYNLIQIFEYSFQLDTLFARIVTARKVSMTIREYQSDIGREICCGFIIAIFHFLFHRAQVHWLGDDYTIVL